MLIDSERVKGVSSFSGLTPELGDLSGVVRISMRMVSQLDGQAPSENAYEVVGKVLGAANLMELREEYKLTDNYGAVFLERGSFKRVVCPSDAVVKYLDSCSLVFGILPTDELKREMNRKRFDFREHLGIIYVSPDQLKIPSLVFPQR